VSFTGYTKPLDADLVLWGVKNCKYRKKLQVGHLKLGFYSPKMVLKQHFAHFADVRPAILEFTAVSI
jgi:hypothetical protein